MTNVLDIIAAAADLKLDIIKNGKIRYVDGTNEPCAEDINRLKPLTDILTKYNYGWKLYGESQMEQLGYLTELVHHILEHPNELNVDM